MMEKLASSAMNRRRRHLAIGPLIGLVLLWTPLTHAQNVAAGDAGKGETVFANCAPCHSTGTNTIVGPGLAGIVGRASASTAGFRYSSAMKRANLVWNETTLDAFIADPQKVVPNNVMPFSGLADAQQRADLIAYLKTLK